MNVHNFSATISPAARKGLTGSQDAAVSQKKKKNPTHTQKNLAFAASYSVSVNHISTESTVAFLQQ